MAGGLSGFSCSLLLVECGVTATTSLLEQTGQNQNPGNQPVGPGGQSKPPAQIKSDTVFPQTTRKQGRARTGSVWSVLRNLSDGSSFGHNKVITALCSLINIHAEGRDLSASPLKTKKLHREPSLVTSCLHSSRS